MVPQSLNKGDCQPTKIMNIQINNEMTFFSTISLLIMILSFSIIIAHNQVMAASKFTIDAKINLKKLNNPSKLKVVASANGDTQVKILEGEDLDLKEALLFHFHLTRRMMLLLLAAGMSILHAPMTLMG